MEVATSSLATESTSPGFTLTTEDEVEEVGKGPTVQTTANHFNRTVEVPPADANAELCSSPCQNSIPINNGGTVIRKKKKKNKELTDFSSSGSGASSSLSYFSHQRNGLRGVTIKSQTPKVSIRHSRRNESDLDALALPLGMSIAAVVAQVLDTNNAARERIPVDHLSKAFGYKFDCFAKNFGKSFQSTLRTLQLINETSHNKERNDCNLRLQNCHQEMVPPDSFDKQDPISNCDMKNCHIEAIPPQAPFSTVEEMQESVISESINQDLILHGQINQQLACISSSTMGSGFNQSMVSTLKQSVIEQARSNDLKAFEIGLTMERMKLKESQLVLNSDSNRLERFKLSMGISKASFKAEKFKNQLEETRHAELLKKCIDCLVAGLVIMSASLAYGAYVYSYDRIMEATESCVPLSKESKSWWVPKPVSSFNSGLQMLRCQVIVVSRMLFGILMILAIAYLLLQRSSTSKQVMPVTFILLLLGVFCGFVGKLCIDTLGGSGYHWLFFWEALCLLHFFANICTSVLFSALHGPISVSPGAEAKTILPYSMRRFAFYAIALLFLPLLGGLMPFASPNEWKDHFSLLISESVVVYRE
ncbi:PREDICTED: protein CPR-5 isoform X2 [Nelumbo nucifera]|uniref:Protein CPR-5-like n=2 Tax=Nelumbo nucifera TaxID=4432 RepID=A0A822XP67_NELNU|nr:PREDICTED: protein CPR-5 isoform X2 [Nelumbo nucifera]DAD21832.1 TPA_asm: hypothetical protein HUJ06_023295 [Nelumbo nucifera]